MRRRNSTVLGTALAVGLIAGGCVTTETDRRFDPALDASIGRWETVDVSQARVRLPPELAQSVILGREMRTAAGEVIQEFVLVNNTPRPGDNVVRVAIDYRADDRRWDAPQRPLGGYDRPVTILADFRDERVSGDITRSHELRRSNALGPYFGVEADYRDNSRCVIAWQTMDAAHAPIAPADRMLIVVRHCDMDSPAQMVAAFMDPLQVMP